MIEVTHVCTEHDVGKIWVKKFTYQFSQSRTSLYTMFLVFFPVGSHSFFGLARILVVCLDTPLDKSNIELSMGEHGLWKVDPNIWDGLALCFVYGHCKTQANGELFSLELKRK